MGLLDAFKKKASSIIRDNKGEVVGITKVDADISKYLGIFDSKVRNRNYITLFSEIEEIQFPVRAIAERALNATYYLKKYDSDEKIWNNPAINKFLTQPNETDTFYEFLTKIIVSLLVTGTAYAYSDSPSLVSNRIERWKRADNYYILPADKTTVNYHNKQKLFQGAGLHEIIKDYTVSTGISNMQFAPENILSIRDLKLAFDGRTMEGDSRLDALKYPISNIIAAYEARNAIFVKRGALGMIVSRKTDESGSVPLRESEKRQIRDSYQRTYGITGDRDAIGISNVDIGFVSFGVSIRELEPFRETLEDAKVIAGAFGVPDVLIPGNNQATYNNVSTAEKAIYQNAVIPLTNRIIEAFNSWLGLSRKWEKGGMYLEADFSEITCLQEDKKFSAEVKRIKSETAIKQYEKGFLTKNQALVEMGLEEIPDGDYYVTEDKNRNQENQIQNQNNTQGK
ncbi:MAG: phage portal protein [Dysgonamonadaceae bacterium]|jgi:HK97 family phage portal protein|nr:phage portal protein [Dysgonamonadaceae bacterium]